MIQSLPIDQNGHLVAYERNQGMVRVLQTPNYPLHIMDIAYSCAWCDEHPQCELIDGVVSVMDACPLPEGATSVVRISVPSGRLVVTDDLRPVFEPDDAGLASYNSFRGQLQLIEAYAALGCAYGPVGNTCPGLYKTGEDTFEIGTPAQPDYDEDYQQIGPDPEYPGEALAGVCTDLWAYSIADYDLWASRGGDTSPEGLADLTVVEVTPGIYELAHHTTERAFDYDAPGPTTFAHVRRVGDI